MKLVWLLHKALDRFIAMVEDRLTGQSSLTWYCPSCGYPGERRLPHLENSYPEGSWSTICHECYDRFDITPRNPCLNCGKP